MHQEEDVSRFRDRHHNGEGKLARRRYMKTILEFGAGVGEFITKQFAMDRYPRKTQIFKTDNVKR